MQSKSKPKKAQQAVNSVQIENDYVCNKDCRICPFPGAKCAAAHNRAIYDHTEDPFSSVNEKA